MAKVSKKQRAFQLFSEGKSPSSPEVKALDLPGSTRLTYHWEWEKRGRPVGIVDSVSTSTPKIKATLPGGETIASIVEVKNPVQKYQEALEKRQEQTREEELVEELNEGAKEPEEELSEEEGGKPKKIEAKVEGVEASSGDNKKKIPTTILGEGLKVTVFLSIGTLALYQIASSVQAQHDGEGELELGEFLDTCAADYFRVRGKTLGLITAGGK